MQPTVTPPPSNTTTVTGTAAESDNVLNTRIRYALIIALVGLFIPGLLVVVLSIFSGSTTKTAWTAAELTSLAGLFTGIVGTLVGAFLGVQVAAAGAQQSLLQAQNATQQAADANARAARAIQQLPSDKQADFL